MEFFSLDREFFSKYKNKNPKWTPLGYITFKRTYSRNGETYPATIKRVVEGVCNVHLDHMRSINKEVDRNKLQITAQELFLSMFNFKILPPGRGLWTMGTSVVEKVGLFPLTNCAFISTKDLPKDITKPFAFMMDALMLGVGVGFDVYGAGSLIVNRSFENLGYDVYKIQDTREGWIEALKMKIESFFGKRFVKFDYSLIREKGAPIKTFGGTASGPEPLRILLEEDIPKILNAADKERLSEANIVDLMNVIGKCVISGNVRRSAQIALGKSIEFAQLKDPDLYKHSLMSHRWASNNSIECSVGQSYKYFAEYTAKNGEPGYFWKENAKHGRLIDEQFKNSDELIAGCNPCGEIALESGELCNLVEVFPNNCVDFSDFQNQLRLAHFYVKNVTLIKSHDECTDEIQKRNRRIGISLSGITQAIKRIGRSSFLDWCNRGYMYLRNLDQKYSTEVLQVNPSIKLTTVKPSGTVSILANATSGIHHALHEYSIRRIRLSSESHLLETLIVAGIKIEDDVYSRNTKVAEFPIKTPDFIPCGSIDEQIQNVIDVQKYWADNMVSVTVHVKDSDRGKIEGALYQYDQSLKSISFLPESHAYQQAPIEKIDAETYKEMMKNIKTNKLLGEEIEHDQSDVYCNGDKCEVSYA